MQSRRDVKENSEVMQVKKVVFYTNQFFGQIGGEEHAGTPPFVKGGCIGPANLLNENLEGEIVATIVCGDNYYAENIETAREFICGEIGKIKPDMLIAGPAFNAGRFGVACGDICAAVEERFGISAVTGMNEENPAVAMYKAKTCIVEVGKSAAGMKKAAAAMARIANKLLRGEELGLSQDDGYFPKGIRVNVFNEKTGAERAVDMLLAKLSGGPYRTEIPLPVYQSVTPAPGVRDLKAAKIALLTSGGIVPAGNPDRLPAATAKFFKTYSIAGVDALKQGDFISVHAGYDPVYANEDPNRVAPLDLLRNLEEEGEIGELHEYLTTTTGNSTSVADATRMGREIAESLKESGIAAAILTST